MHYTFVAAALATASTVVFAAPAEILGRKAFRVPQVAGAKYVKNGPQEMLRIYEKYARHGAVVPDRVRLAAAAAPTGSVSAVPGEGDVSYLCAVTIGGVTLEADVDTGSSDLWVTSTLLPPSQQAGHAIYDPSKSGKKLEGETFNIMYADGSGATGPVYSDKVTMGGISTTMAVGLVESLAGQFLRDKTTDGLLGLAFDNINTVKPDQQKTFFSTIMDSLEKPLFAADLKAGEPGSYDFGFIDSSKYTGEISYVPVDNSRGFWGFTADGYAAGSDELSGSIGDAIMDTGTTLMVVPDEAVEAYYASVEGASMNEEAGGYTFPCSTDAPDFNVEIGGTTFAVSGKLINFAPIDKSGETCFGGLQSNSGLPQSIFGDIFMKGFYIVFDDNNGSPQLGIATKP